MQVIGILLAAVVGLVMWGIVLVFLGGNPLGKTGLSDYMMMFSPVVGVVLPVVMKLIEEQRFVLASWLAALAPFTSVFSIGVCFLTASATGQAPDGWGIPVIVAIVVWIVPAVVLFRRLGVELDEMQGKAEAQG